MLVAEHFFMFYLSSGSQVENHFAAYTGFTAKEAEFLSV